MIADHDPGDENDSDACECGCVCRVERSRTDGLANFTFIMCRSCQRLSMNATLLFPIVSLGHVHTVTV